MIPGGYLYGADRIHRLEEAIGFLEGRSFGPHLKFSSQMDGLRFSLDGGWKPTALKDLPGLAEFAAELNVAMAPIIDRYRLMLRQELSNQAVKLAAEALAK